MRRVMIVGGPGSGKSTLALQLGAKTGLPVFHMDHIHWQPGWIDRPTEEKDRLTHEVHMLNSWIFEGGHSRTYPERIARADTYIWLDIPVTLRLWRILRRNLTTLGQTRPDMSPGCPERLNIETIKFIDFILRTRRKTRTKHQVVVDNPPPHLTVHHLKSLLAVRAFLATAHQHKNCSGETG